jgi:hypothetical protein
MNVRSIISLRRGQEAKTESGEGEFLLELGFQIPVLRELLLFVGVVWGAVELVRRIPSALRSVVAALRRLTNIHEMRPVRRRRGLYDLLPLACPICGQDWFEEAQPGSDGTVVYVDTRRSPRDGDRVVARHLGEVVSGIYRQERGLAYYEDAETSRRYRIVRGDREAESGSSVRLGPVWEHELPTWQWSSDDSPEPEYEARPRAEVELMGVVMRSPRA